MNSGCVAGSLFTGARSADELNFASADASKFDLSAHALAAAQSKLSNWKAELAFDFAELTFDFAGGAARRPDTLQPRGNSGASTALRCFGARLVGLVGVGDNGRALVLARRIGERLRRARDSGEVERLGLLFVRFLLRLRARVDVGMDRGARAGGAGGGRREKRIGHQPIQGAEYLRWIHAKVWVQ